MIMIDTSVLVEIDEVRLPDDSLHLSAISLAELRFGISRARTIEERNLRVRRLARIENLIPTAWLPFDDRAASGAGEISAVISRTRPGHARSRDALLAGHAYAIGAQILTLNPKDFELVADRVGVVVAERIDGS